MLLETRPTCLVRLGCSSERSAENDILGRKCTFRDSYPRALVLNEAFLLKIHSYIGALGLYEMYAC